MPRLDGHGPNGLWSRRLVAERAVRSHGVVMPPPLFDQDRFFPQRVEDLAIQQLIPELAVEAFIVSVPLWVISGRIGGLQIMSTFIR